MNPPTAPRSRQSLKHKTQYGSINSKKWSFGCTVSILLTYSITFESKSQAPEFFHRRFCEIQGRKTRGQKPIIIVILACLLTQMPPKWIAVWQRKIQNACAAINCVCKWGEMDLLRRMHTNNHNVKNTVALSFLIKVQKNVHSIFVCA